MSVVLAILMVLRLVAIVTLIAVTVLGVRADERDERARLESEARRAEYRLHHLASDAFTQMMDVAREHGYRGEQ